MADATVRAVNWIGIAVGVLIIAAVAAAGGWASVRDHEETEALAHAQTGGTPSIGHDLVEHLGCAGCHTIPGIRRANATVGPPLTKIAYRSYIAGVLDNSPDNLVRWLRDPPSVVPGTAMPNLGLSDTDARDIAAFLYTLK